MIKTNHLMRKLVKLIEPDKKYPVNYTINQNGEKKFDRTELVGKNLTENQIFDLWHFGQLKIEKCG